MSRDDEIAVIQRSDKTWWVGRVAAQNYEYHKEKGMYIDVANAIEKAIELNKKFGYTEYGIRIYGYSEHSN